MQVEFSELKIRLREALQSESLSVKMSGAVLFGSHATGKATAESDMDLLVVAEGLPAKRHHRLREIVEIKELLPGTPLDVMLLTPAEVFSNFANHNPLFLDLAEDGEILIDRGGVLAQAMERARRYVREKGIARTGGGWRFPVKPHAVTYLSKVSNRDFAVAMLQDAGRDRQIGETLLQREFYDKAVYHSQQAVEKGVKAALVALGVFRKTHLVGTILRKAATEDIVPVRWQAALAEAARLSEELEPEVGLSRYPGIIDDVLWLPSAEYSEEDAAQACAKAGRVLDVVRSFVEEWFGGAAEG